MTISIVCIRWDLSGRQPETTRSSRSIAINVFTNVLKSFGIDSFFFLVFFASLYAEGREMKRKEKKKAKMQQISNPTKRKTPARMQSKDRRNPYQNLNIRINIIKYSSCRCYCFVQFHCHCHFLAYRNSTYTM